MNELRLRGGPSAGIFSLFLFLCSAARSFSPPSASFFFARIATIYSGRRSSRDLQKYRRPHGYRYVYREYRVTLPFYALGGLANERLCMRGTRRSLLRDCTPAARSSISTNSCVRQVRADTDELVPWSLARESDLRYNLG